MSVWWTRPMNKLPKDSVSYSDRGSDKEHCAICGHYQGDNTCAIVAGRISPRGWCERFRKTKEAA